MSVSKTGWEIPKIPLVPEYNSSRNSSWNSWCGRQVACFIGSVPAVAGWIVGNAPRVLNVAILPVNGVIGIAKLGCRGVVHLVSKPEEPSRRSKQPVTPALSGAEALGVGTFALVATVLYVFRQSLSGLAQRAVLSLSRK